MPLYHDLGFYVPSNSYSPYGYTSYSSPYARAISGTYTAPPPRSALHGIGRHYKPMLKPISETPYQSSLRSSALTTLTRMNSGKYNNVPKTSSSYVAPRPIQINTADIDVSAAKFDKHRHTRVRSTSPEPCKTESTENETNVHVESSSDASAFMPRVDQHDPPQFRSTIKRDRNIVRLSTMRRRSLSRSKSNSIEKRRSSKRSNASRKSTSSKKSSSDEQQDVDETDNVNVKKSWRDKFGDSLHADKRKVVRKTPGELILEKHIIRDKRNEDYISRMPSAPPQAVIRLPETVTPQEITYLEPIIRKSIRRQSLIKCPSFKDICKDISSDIKCDDDLNAGDLRRRASLILEQEGQILAQLANSRPRRPSADFVNVEAPIIEDDEALANADEKQQEVEQNEEPHENIIIIKKKTKKKGGKLKHKITVSVDVDNPVVPVLTVDPNSETSVNGGPRSPRWKAVVEEVEEDETVHKVVKLPKKRTLRNETESSQKLKKSESGIDFWQTLGRRDSAFYKIDLKRNEMDIIELLDDPAVTTSEKKTDGPEDESIVAEKSLQQEEQISVSDAAKQSTEQNEIATEMSKEKEDEDSTQITATNRERKHSIGTIKSRSTDDLQEMKEKKKLKVDVRTKVSKLSESDAQATESELEIAIDKNEETQTLSDTKKTEATAKKTSAKQKKSKESENVTEPNVSIKSSNTENLSNATATASMQVVDPKIKSGPTASEPETNSVKPSDAIVQPTVAKEESILTIDAKVTADDTKVKNKTKSVVKKTAAKSSALNKCENKDSADEKPKTKLKKTVSSQPSVAALDATEQPSSDAVAGSKPTEASDQHENNININNNTEIGSNVDDNKRHAIAAKSSISIETEQHDVSDKDAKSDTVVDTNNNNVQSSTRETAVGLSKFPTVNNLSGDLSSLIDSQINRFAIKQTSGESNEYDDCYISGDESLDLLLSSDDDLGDSDQSSYTESEDEMGLKRRHKKKKEKFDPKKVVKLDHKRKCYVIEEAPKYPLIATPRPLQKKYHYYSESETESDESDSDSSSSDECYDECLSPNDVVVKDVIRMSTCSNDSGFSGGGTAPSSPKKMLGFQEARDSPSTPPSHNPVYKIESNQDSDDLETSYTYAQFQRTGTITAPATTIPRFKRYSADDFHFLTVLGKGSFGKVLLAELRNTEYYYAVKCLKKDVVLEDDDVECTLIERKVLALGTKHPYLCHLFCTFQTESHLFFVMEYLNGGDLMFHIQVSGRFPEPRARFYAAEIASGLKFLHKKGIIYRDLKLDNILLDFEGHVRIADFGMCKLQIYLDRTADSFCGTPDYMAPEVIKGQKYTQNVDWWSFGVLLYEMLIGQSPFSGCDEDELFWSICNELPWYPFYLSKDSLNILTKLLEKDANVRLGATSSPHGDITENAFFYEIDWKKLERRQLEPPFRPKVKHPLDTQYFDRAFTRERVRLTPIDKEILQSMDQNQFQGFTYTNPNATPS